MSLSFRQAFLAKENGKISWEEYIHTLLVSWTGVKHEEERTKGWHKDLQKLDPFAHSIWLWSMGYDHVTEKVEDTKPLEAVFKAYRQDTLDGVKDKVGQLHGRSANGVIRALSLLSLQDRRTDVLQFCTNIFDRSKMGPYDENFYNEANTVDEKKDPAVFKVLEQSDFRIVHPRGVTYEPKPNESDEEIGARPGVPESFDIGGKFPVPW